MMHMNNTTRESLRSSALNTATPIVNAANGMILRDNMTPVYHSGPATSLAVLFAAMVTMKELLVVDHNHNGYQVIVIGITMEDGSGFSWNIHTQYGSTIHIRTI